MKKKILFIVSAIVCLCISFGVGASFADESPWAYDSGTGRTVLTDGTEKFYINSESARYVLDGTLRGDYSVSASFQGNVSITDTTTDRFDIGLLVWYYDQNNWVSLSLAWWNGFSDAKVTDVLVVTCDGGALSYADHYFDNPTYNANAVFTKYATDKVTISATKTYDAVNGYDVYTFYGEGEEMFTQNIGVSAKYRSAAARVGYVGNCAAAAFTFEAPTISVPGPDGTPVEYSEIAGAPAGVKGVGNWSFTDDKYTISSDNSAYVNHIVVGNEYSDTNYKVDIEVSFLAATNESAVLLSGWYVGQSDMVAFVLKNTDAGWVVATEGKINGADIAAASKAISFDGNVTLQIAKIGQRISLNYNDETLLQYSAGELENGTDCVFGVGNADASLKISFDSVPYNAYDFYQYSQNGITYRVSAPDMDSVSIDDTGIVMEATADNLTRLVYNAPSSGTVTLTAGFGGTATYFGAYMYYVDEDNNIAVAIEENKITLITKMGGEETSESFGYSGTADTLTLSVKGRTISAFVNDSAVFENVEVAGINIVDVFAIGFFAKNGTLNITGIEASGFRPFSDVLDGKFVLRGDSFSTWQVDGEKLIGDCTNGTTWNATLAFTANEFLPSDGYYVASAIQVTAKTGTEWKAGILPVYIDNGNFVYVWISQWAGQGVTILMNSFINGAICGETWRETSVTCDITQLNYLEINVSGDKVSVYLNRSFAPSAVAIFEGLSGITGSNFMGFNIYQVSAEFSEIGISPERMFVGEEKPTISYVGNKPATGTVGTSVKLPIISAKTESTGATAEVEVSVTHGGKEITVDKNSFTPEEAGDYLVTVVAKDVWGNMTSDSFTVSVTAKESEGGSKGCGQSANGLLAVTALTVLLGGCLLGKIR